MFNSRQQRKRTDFPNVTSLLEGRNLVELSLTVPLKCNLLSGPFCYSQFAVEDVYKQGFPPPFFFFLLTAFFSCFVFECLSSNVSLSSENEIAPNHGETLGCVMILNRLLAKYFLKFCKISLVIVFGTPVNCYRSL